MDDAARFEAMTAGMILDRSFRLYVQNFLLLFGIVAVANLPTFLSAILMGVAGTMGGGALSIIIILLSTIGSLLTWVVVVPWSTGAATHLVSQAYLGKEPSFRKAVSAAWNQVGTLLVASIIVGLIVMGGLLLLVIPGIFLWLSYALIAPVIMTENTDWNEARHRSWELATGYRGKIFVVIAVIMFLQLVLQFGAVGFITAFAGLESTVGELAGTLTQWGVSLLCTPLQIVALILLYYDLRIRKEGFDLELLSGTVQRPVAGSMLGLT